MAARVPPESAHAPHQGAARLTSEQVSAINRFPDDNPNPVMRIDAGGHLIYANPASGAILRTLGISVGDPVPAQAMARPDVLPRESQRRCGANPRAEPGGTGLGTAPFVLARGCAGAS